MPEGTGGGNLVSLRDVYDIVSRLEGSVGSRLDELERKMDAANRASADRVDRVASRMDHFEGALATIKWLGPTGLVALLFGIAKGIGFF